jgi:hypothetical protein
LRADHGASSANSQFQLQAAEEQRRLEQAVSWRIHQGPSDMGSLRNQAAKTVKARWIEQGIWRDRWTKDLGDTGRIRGRWKHEHPSQPVPAEEERDREASRPYQQCVDQVSRERERIRVEMNPPRPPLKNPMLRRHVYPSEALFEMEMELWRLRLADDLAAANRVVVLPPDVNTTAYERVKSRWINWRIWNDKWGVFPGMTWKHETPLVQFLEEEMHDSVDPGPDRFLPLADQPRGCWTLHSY